jgi:hypothetical protein
MIRARDVGDKFDAVPPAPPGGQSQVIVLE